MTAEMFEFLLALIGAITAVVSLWLTTRRAWNT